MPSSSFLQQEDNLLQLPATAYLTKINDDAFTQLNKSNTSQNIIQEEPTINDYVKYNKNITFSYHPYLYKFQQGPLGEHDSYLIGLLNLNFLSSSSSSSININNIYFQFQGKEKVKWMVKDGPRSKRIYGEEKVLCDVKYKIWESTTSNNNGSRLMDLLSQICNDGSVVGENDSIVRIPFKLKLPYNLPDSIETDFGSVEYTLKAVITISNGGVGNGNGNGNGISATGGVILSTILQQRHSSEIKLPLKNTLILNNDNNPPYIIHGENTISSMDAINNVPPELNYTLVLPPNKSINIGVYVSIPIRIRILKPGIILERIEIMLKTSKDFRTKNSESKHVKEISSKMVIPRKNINFMNSKYDGKKKINSGRVDGECIQNINFYIPNDTLPTYNGRFITVTHQLLLSFCLLHTNHRGKISRLNDFTVEEHINISNMQKNFNIQLPNAPLPPKFFNPRQFTNTQFTSGIDSLQCVIPKSNFTSNSSKSSNSSSGSSKDSLSIDSLYYYSRPASSLFSLHSINSIPSGGILRVLSTQL